MCALGTMYCAPTMENAESGVGTQEALAWRTGTDLSPPLHGVAQPSFLSLFLTGWRAGSIQIGRESMERVQQDLREGR